MAIRLSDLFTGCIKESRHLTAGEVVYPVRIESTKVFYSHKDGLENSGYSANLQKFKLYRVVRNLKMSITLLPIDAVDTPENRLRCQKTAWHYPDQVKWNIVCPVKLEAYLKETK